MSKDRVQLRLIFDVDYEPHGTSTHELVEMLEYVATHAMNEGLVTGETPAEVHLHRISVEEIAVNTPLPCAEPRKFRVGLFRDLNRAFAGAKTNNARLNLKADPKLAVKQDIALDKLRAEVKRLLKGAAR